MLTRAVCGYPAKGQLPKRLARWLVGVMAIVLLMVSFTFIKKIVFLKKDVLVW